MMTLIISSGYKLTNNKMYRFGGKMGDLHMLGHLCIGNRGLGMRGC